MKLSVDVEIALRVTSEVLRKLPFAAASAITQLAKEAVDAGQKEVAADFTIRKKFILQRIRVLQYAKANNLVAIVGIDTKVQGSPLLLGFFEQGGTKLPTTGPGIAVPITGSPARPSFQSLNPPSFKYAALHLDAQGKGAHNTFTVPGVGVFERLGPGDGPDAVKLLYLFERSAPLKKQMNLIAVFREVVTTRWQKVFHENYMREIGRIK